ncbi:high affinity copper uptake protein 1-like isoform X2 [Saccostrea cucullata]|uniref:high affinity copper uptake protein 1-like isoform X2 n=1 Tax=Saccostrea cuccullata TaxID=36930 RepID=UPI002ED4457F
MSMMNMSMTTMSMMNMTGMTGHDHHNMHHGSTGMTGMTMDHSGHDMSGHGGMGGGMGGHEGMHMNMNDTDGCGNGMSMFFHAGKCEYILFDGVQTKTVAGMVAACIIVFLLAVLYEGLKVFREYLLKKALITGSKYQEVTIGANGQSIVAETNIKNSHQVVFGNPILHNRLTMISTSHLIQTTLHVVQVFISYCLMLIFMTYNVWLCLAVILGAGAGYFFFGWKRAVVVDVNEHCH